MLHHETYPDRRNCNFSALGARKLWSHCALAFTLTLGLATLAPSAQGQTFSVLHSFTGGADGSQPVFNGLIQNGSGTLYGSTGMGGNLTCNSGAGCGVVFKMDPVTGKETVLYRFTNGADGAFPGSTLLLVGTVLYGIGGGGPFPSFGNVFKLDNAGNATVAYSFTGGTDGAYPFGSLAHDAVGNVYGATEQGGLFVCNDDAGCGTVFKIDTAGNESVLYSFTEGDNGVDGKDGAFPTSGVIRDSAGNLYGTTPVGGVVSCFGIGCGTVFKVDSSGTQTVLYSFTAGADGLSPSGALVRDSAGNLYGTTAQGGGSGCSGGFGCGTVFKIDSAGNETLLYSFKGGADGDQPIGGLIRDSAGNIYGTTVFGGNLSCGSRLGCGTVFKLDGAGIKKVLHRFGGLDGAYPYTALIRDSGGNLYGTTSAGGTAGHGTVYKVAP
jgi:uncharacterized repeat protein (TIGR03803 family)